MVTDSTGAVGSRLGKGISLRQSGEVCDTGGHIDYVSQGVGWDIELVRDGENLKRHLARFEAGGAYSDWILGQDLADWIVTYFHRTIPISMSRTQTHLH